MTCNHLDELSTYLYSCAKYVGNSLGFTENLDLE